MNILLDLSTTQDQFANRGIGVYTHQLLSHLLELSRSKNNGDKFYLLLFDAPSTLDDEISKYSDIVEVINIGKLRSSDKLNFLWWNCQFKPAVNKIAKQVDLDFYFCPYFWRYFPINNVYKTVVMIHDLAFAVQGKYSNSGNLGNRIRKFQYHRALNRVSKADLVFTNSEHTKKDFLEYVDFDSNKVNTIYLGVSENIKNKKVDLKVLNKYIIDEAIKDGYILYYGGVEPNKNVPAVISSYIEFLDIWKSKFSDNPPFLVLAGGAFVKPIESNPELVEINRLITAAKIKDNVLFTGFYEEVDHNDLLNGAQLFIHLSSYEGFGFSPLEAMKAGVPTIASNLSCYPEILGDGAILVDPSDYSKTANLMLDLLKNSEKFLELSNKGLRQVQKYTWAQTAQNTYKKLKDYE